jgi:phosphonate transport system substrate-binding protein
MTLLARAWLSWMAWAGWLFMTAAAAAALFYGPGMLAAPDSGSEPAKDQAPEYLFGVFPSRPPTKTFEVYQPIFDYLSLHVPGARFRLEASGDSAQYEKKLTSRRFHFALVNPYQTIRSFEYGYRVFGKMAPDEDFRGIILVRRDSGIETLADLKGKTVAFPAPTTVGSTMLTQYFLQTHGVDVKRDIHSVYVRSQESCILNVYHRFAAAAGSRPQPWAHFQAQHPEKAKELVVKWETESLINNALVVRDDVPRQTLDKTAATLFSLNNDEAGRKLLDAIPISRFEPADNAAYEPMRAFLKKFEETVGPLKSDQR